ncbi:hypothetical protein NQZ79_g3877 [Umbelopsis isabellina]|nr:hypothetical protein NQZ79_g3877 [Umbelopsis isabellina]
MTSPKYQLAQVNVGLGLADIDDPIMAEFKNNLDNINGLAESSPGFVWRLKSDTGNATDIKVYDNDFALVNLSVWDDKDSLFEFVYKTAHKDFIRQRRLWFGKWDGPHMALWWIEKGCYPTEQDAKARLDYLAKNGPSPHAFTFRSIYPPPSE